MTIRIVLADDHAIVREGLRSLLGEREDMEVVGEAGDGRSAIKLTRQLRPDVVVMDIGMPELNGIETTRQIAVDVPAAKIIGLSMHAESRIVAEMFCAGASGYLLKECIAEELIRAIQTVVANRTYLSPSISGSVVQDYVLHRARDESSPFHRLSQREREVLQLLAEGVTVKEIAGTLNLSINTINTHRQNVMKKLDLHSIAELTKYAVREGLTRP